MESIARRDPSKAVEYQSAIRKSNERLAHVILSSTSLKRQKLTFDRLNAI